MPSIGSMVRTRWSSLVDGDPRRLHTAFALESVNDELIFVIGPALVTVLATQLTPASGIATASLLCVVGTLLFAAQRKTEPAPRPKPRPADPSQFPRRPAPAGPLAPAGKLAPEGRLAAVRARLSRPSLPARGLGTLSWPFLLIAPCSRGST